MNNHFRWGDCEQVIAERLENSFGWDHEGARQVAEIAADAMRKEFGGKRVYLPTKNGDFRARVRREFSGRNITELSRLYGLSCMTIRRYLKKE